MIPYRDECRWCGSSEIFELGLCYFCFEEYKSIEEEAELILQDRTAALLSSALHLTLRGEEII